MKLAKINMIEHIALLSDFEDGEQPYLLFRLYDSLKELPVHPTMRSSVSVGEIMFKRLEIFE